MAPLHLVCVVLALVLFGVAVWQSSSPVWNQLIAAGLAALALSMIL
jgi:hypothetical protein